MCREQVGNSFKDDGFFELIDIDGKDDVVGLMENQIEIRINRAVGFLLDLPEYSLKDKADNPHIKIDLN